MKRACVVAICALTLLFAPRMASAQVKPPDPATVKVSGALSGAQIYAMTCGACHQANGAGLASQFPPLGPSEYVTGDPDRLIHIVLRGLTGEIEVEGEMFKGEMPGWAPALTDAQVASVLTYVRQAFGNNAPAIPAQRVATVRAATVTRKKPYSALELARLPAVTR